LEEPDFELVANSDALVVAPDKPLDCVINVQRRGPPHMTVGPITIEAMDLPSGVSATPVVSQPTGDSAAKVTLRFSTNGAAFSGRIHIQGTAREPRPITRRARTPQRFGACFDALWLTAIAQ
jgi:hypothetical protein